MGGCDSSCNRRRPRRKARSSAAGDRAATGRARRAEERRQGAHGNAASGGAYHRGDEGGRGGLATPCSAPVLVLEPGDVRLGNRKATAIGRRRAAAPTPLTGNGSVGPRYRTTNWCPRSRRSSPSVAARSPGCTGGARNRRVAQAKTPYTVMQHPMHSHPTVSELIPTMDG